MGKEIITNGVELRLTSGLRDINDKYKYLNSGGCIYVAKWIGEAFLERGIKVSYLILDNCSVDVANCLRGDFIKYANTESLEDLAERMIEVSHVLPFINNGLYMDSKGIAKSFKNSKWVHLSEMGYITHETIERWSRDRYYRWNPTFLHNHGYQLLHIEKDIKDLIKSLDI